MSKKYFVFGAVLSLMLLVATSFALANHSWGNYHWARTANPFTLKLGDNVGSAWDSSLAGAASDWSLSSVLDFNLVPGQSSLKTCKAVLGTVQVCNSRYGNNGWLGVASIWATGDHITQGTVKLNDTYFNTSKYNTPAWRNFVACQEVGHTLGLDHQDVIFDNPNLGTCMDYTNSPGTNQHPNQHDYDELEVIYAHLDITTTIAQSAAASSAAEVGDEPSSWGKLVSSSHKNGTATYERDFGHGNKVFTFVIWTE